MSGLPDYAAAIERALSVVAPGGDVETCAVGNTVLGRVLAEPIHADRDFPPFDRAQMDGYAIRASEVGGQEAWPVHRTVPAGVTADFVVPAGTCVAIATGAALPGGVDTVIPHEQSDRGDPVRFHVEAVDAGSAVHPRGADAAAGDEIVATGTVLSAQHVGIAAAVGVAEMTVRRRPRLVILTSGDEVVDEGHAPAPHEIRNSNGPMLAALLARCGADPMAHRHVEDELEPTVRAVATALEEADIVITVGGISAGDRDHFPPPSSATASSSRCAARGFSRGSP